MSVRGFVLRYCLFFFFFKQKTAYEFRISDWISDVCSSDLPTFDADLLARYDRPGPRYTSYPTAPQFADGFGEEQLRAAVLASNGDPIPRRLPLYVHVPFCLSPCFYCGCNRIITRDQSRAGTSLARLYRELGLRAALFARDLAAHQAALGCGPAHLGQTG